MVLPPTISKSCARTVGRSVSLLRRVVLSSSTSLLTTSPFAFDLLACTRQILVERWEWFRSLRLGRNVSGKTDTHPSFPNTPRGRLMSRNQLHLPEPYPIAMALVQYFYTLSLRTPLQRQPLVISTLLQVASIYGEKVSIRFVFELRRC